MERKEIWTKDVLDQIEGILDGEATMDSGAGRSMVSRNLQDLYIWYIEKGNPYVRPETLRAYLIRAFSEREKS